MPDTITFKSLDEKHLLCEVQSMFWSPKMDLIAISTLNGEVILYRLSLHKVWTIKKLDDNPMIIVMAWRSDGKILAVAYNTNQIRLHSVESGDLLYSFHPFGVNDKSNKITFLTWSLEFEDAKKRFFTGTNSFSIMEELATEYTLESSSDHFLPNLPEFLKQEFNSEFKNIKSEKMSLLIVGDAIGCLSLYAYGIIQFAVIQLPMVQTILSATFSQDFSSLSVVACGENLSKDIYLCDTKLLFDFSKEIFMVSSSFAYLWYLEKYVNMSIIQMKESWEDILLEVDQKMNKLAVEKSKRGTESVRKEFLMLLVYGKASDELAEFLKHDLTNQSLSKLGTSIVNSYSNILKLLLKHLQSVIQRISFELADMKGLSLITDRYGPLGLRPEEAVQALDMAGSFMLKSVELQQVIEKSLSNFKAFFNWILPIKNMFSSENTTASVKQGSDVKIELVAQFINENFNQPIDPNKPGFKLEKVGQYLENEDLSCPCENTNTNSWKTLLENNKKLAENPLIYKTYYEKSLIQLHNMVILSIDKMVTNSMTTISKSLFPNYRYHLSVKNLVKMSPICQILSKDGNEILSTFSVETLNVKSGFCILKQNYCSKKCSLLAMKIHKVGDLSNIRIMDLDFFNPNILILLVQVDGDTDGGGGEKLSFISQISTQSNNYMPVGDDYVLDDLNDFKNIDGEIRFDGLNASSNMRPVEFAVSGPRKTACILFSSRRRIKLFLAEDDDETSMQISQLDCSNLGHSDPDIQSSRLDRINLGLRLPEVDLTSSEVMDYSLDNDNKENTV